MNKPDDSGNTLTIKDTISSNIVNRLFAGYANIGGFGNSTANSNIANINATININGTSKLMIRGGYAYVNTGSAQANSNKLFINNSIKSYISDISGGIAEIYKDDVIANSNTVDINTNIDSTLKNIIQGGFAKVGDTGNADASYNTVNINGNIKSNGSNSIYRGYADTKTGTATATNNTVNLLSNASFTTNTHIYGGDVWINGTELTYQDNFDQVAKGNTLNIKTKNIKIAEIKNFEFVNFYLPNDIKANDTILTLNEASTDLSKSKIGVG
ncbi:hypothetical protein [Campylobacter iguaniorum]|uniref:hypothetical protein n=1 Tax=Campylobacter iguaniorum TaxID=1244531 RepID=UPI0007C971A5|nr:hypothetical protein [Campylobacter iguaniorum]